LRKKVRDRKYLPRRRGQGGNHKVSKLSGKIKIVSATHGRSWDSLGCPAGALVAVSAGINRGYKYTAEMVNVFKYIRCQR